ncbi:MAG TPA: hypothetical protein VMD08_08810, partial [Candidatus Baltobacteraceae bacterium]|nr:hypothetical protein [Candidatus Baltobacteraceae bacterium]
MNATWKCRRPRTLSLMLLLAAVAWAPSHALADDAQDARQLVEKARLTLQAFTADKEMGPPLKRLLRRATGVLIYPQVLRAAFLVGASGGSGALVVHEAQTKQWAGPAF